MQNSNITIHLTVCHAKQWATSSKHCTDLLGQSCSAVQCACSSDTAYKAVFKSAHIPRVVPESKKYMSMPSNYFQQRCDFFTVAAADGCTST